jgi:hypothetical protein
MEYWTADGWGGEGYVWLASGYPLRAVPWTADGFIGNFKPGYTYRQRGAGPINPYQVKR